MRRPMRKLLLPLLLLVWPGVPAASAPTPLACGKPLRIAVPAPAAVAELVSVAPGPAWLAVHELGQDIDLDSGANPRAQAPLPPRFGRWWLYLQPGESLRLRRSWRNPAAGQVQLELDCSGATSPARDWLLRATPSLERTRKALPLGNDPAPLVADLRALEAVAPDAYSRALARHAVAQAWLMNGRSNAASAAFAQAAQAWRAAGAPQQALAARVGEVEDLHRAGRFDEVLQTLAAMPPAAGESYFAVRLDDVRCSALASLARAQQARGCYQRNLARLQRLGELNESLVVRQSLASVEQTLGRHDRAAALLADALPLAARLGAGFSAGRIHLQLASLAAERGHVGSALRELSAALAVFDSGLAGEVNLRWQANTLIQLAELYTELGAHDEAYLAIADALARLSAADARECVAQALEALARVDRARHREALALRWLDGAAHLYAALGEHDRAAAAQVDALRLRAQQGRLDAAALAALRGQLPRHAPALDLLGAELALTHGDRVLAARLLAHLHARDLPLGQRLQLARLRSRAARESGDSDAADAALRDALAWLDTLAQSTASSAFAQLLRASAWPLRSSAWQAVLDDADRGTVDAAARAWRWLPLATPRAHTATAQVAPRLQAFDRALAAQLLPALTHASDGTAQALLDTLAAAPSDDARYRAATLPELAQFQRSVPAATVVMAWLDGGERSGVLWITRERAWLAPAAAPAVLRAAIAELRASLHAPATPSATIAAAAARVSAALWPAQAPGAPPDQLVVLADKTLAAVPWPLLPWPGQSAPLLDTTTTRVADLVDGTRSAPPALQVHALIAAPAVAAALPALQVAKAEPGLIRDAAGAAVALSVARASRAGVLAALAEPTAIVHVAAHGMTSQGRLGYAGLWLDADASAPDAGSEGGEVGAGAQVDFLSWLDVIEQPTRAPLVVLNACQLGADNDAIANGSSSFAQALVQSGADAVVAALWPVSDSASALWVPAFYASLAADPERDAASALRAAQRRLRDSRAFRHPFYWASLAAYARLPVQAPH